MCRFGFVVYKTKEAAANAVEHLNGKSIPNLTGPAAERKVCAQAACFHALGTA